MTGPGSAPSSNANKLCKKCKQNVTNAKINFKVTRCFGCGGYNHIVANCKEEKLCLKCGENTHSEVDCLNPAKCVNCERANKLHNLNLGTSHLCYDVNCELWKHQVKKCKKSTQYDS
jgi:hypothetical protein